eukprot:Skav205409  [mRNA]  locus=scaffold170:25384:26895:+ [translate_table: standard]
MLSEVRKMLRGPQLERQKSAAIQVAPEVRHEDVHQESIRIQQLRKGRLQDCPRYGAIGVLITGCAPSRLRHRCHHVGVQRVEVRCLLELLSGQNRLSVVLVEAVALLCQPARLHEEFLQMLELAQGHAPQGVRNHSLRLG